MRTPLNALMFGTAIIGSTLLLHGCFFETAKDDKNKSPHTEITTPTPPNIDPSLTLEESMRREEETRKTCQSRYEHFNVFKFPLPASQSPTCKDCVTVPSLINYMLPNQLNDNFWVVVEAFDNPLFLGNPLSVQSEPGFRPQKAGETKEMLLTLPVGKVYLRSYLTQQQDAIPYSYMGMSLVSNKPMGYYGVLSTPAVLTVSSHSNDPCPAPVNIYLDKLFKDANSEPPTQAKLRIQMTLDSGVKIPDHRLVHIRLHDSPDFAKQPLHEYTVASETFMIEERLGRAEFVTPNLEIGSYYVEAYVDENGNNFVDLDEVQGFVSADRLPKAVSVVEHRVDVVPVMLSKLKR